MLLPSAMRTALHILLGTLLLPTLCFAQVHSNKPIVLTGATGTDRQVTGLDPSTAPDDALAAGIEQSGVLRTLPTVTGNAWIATLPGLSSVPTVGLHVVVKAPSTNSGEVTLVLNGQGPYALKQGSAPVDGSTLEEGTMLSLVFDGDAMQLINGRNDVRRSCPGAMVQVNAQFCIEPGQRPGTDFFTAAVTCASAGRRLCSWSEFHLACINTGPLGLTGTEDNWEWSNNTANEDNSVRVVGSGTCFSASTWPATGSTALQYRCCYSR